MKILDNVFESLGKSLDWAGSSLEKVWGKSRSPWWGLFALWVVVSFSLLLNVLDTIRSWRLLEGVNGAPTSFFSAWGLYPIGGRLLLGVLFLALFLWLSRRSRGWLLGLSLLYFALQFLDVDGLVLDTLESRDTLLLVPSAELEGAWPTVVTGVKILAAVGIIIAVVDSYRRSKAFVSYRTRLRSGISNLRISEVILWVVLLVQGALFVLAWVYLWLGEDAFPVLTTYPAAGRLAIAVIFLVVVALSVRRRSFLLTVATASYAGVVLNIDSMLVQQFGQADRFNDALFATRQLSSVIGLSSLLEVVVPILLLWVALISVGAIVRRRTRSRISAWVDERRTAIYGAEDLGPDVPTRISVLAVLSLVAAIVFPLLGLVLAYAARNDFVAAKPRKSGLDLAIAATIIGWFGLGVQLLFVITAVVGGLVGDFSVTELVFAGISALFGF